LINSLQQNNNLKDEVANLNEQLNQTKATMQELSTSLERTRDEVDGLKGELTTLQQYRNQLLSKMSLSAKPEYGM